MEEAVAHQFHPTKVPGEPIKQKEYALNKDLTKLSKRELLDLKSRQQKLLENKSWLKRLPDKGQKIQDLYDRVVEALNYRSDVDAASKLLSSLHLGTSNLNNLEWEGTIETQKKPAIDSDDDDEPPNPFEILVSSNSVLQNKKIVKNVVDPNERRLITEQDMIEAKEIENGELHFDPATENMCQNEKMESSSQRFLPYKSTQAKEAEKLKEGKSCPKKIRDNSAATPPVISKGVVMLTLRESIEIEHHQQKVMKNLLEKQAAERLEAKIKELNAAGIDVAQLQKNKSLPNPLSMSKYRLAPENDDGSLVADSDEDKSDDTLSDDDDDGRCNNFV